MDVDSLKNGKGMKIYKENGALLNDTENKLFKDILSSLPSKIKEYGSVPK